MTSSSDKPHTPFLYLGNDENLGTILSNQEAPNEPDFYISEDDSCFCLEMDLPGVTAADLLVEVINGMLYITGTRHFHSSQKVYRRIFCLHAQAMDISELKANLAHGVLLVTVPKTKKPKVQVIPVTTQETNSSVIHHASTRSNEETTAEHYY